MKVTKAIIAAAGYGTRFLPATKSVPKELITFIDQPVLEYITEECVQAGITDIIIVTSYGKNAIENYLDSSKELEAYLESKGESKAIYLEKVRHVYQKANFYFVRQPANLPVGTATPLWVVRKLIDKTEPFAYLFGDDVFQGRVPAIKDLIDEYELNQDRVKGILGGYEVSKDQVSKYGVFDYEEDGSLKLFKNVIEKPEPDQIISNLVRTGRFVYHADIFNYFDTSFVKTNPRGEYEMTDVENAFVQDGNDLGIKEISAEWYPVGDPENYLRSTIRLALQKDRYKDIVREECGR